MSQFHDRPYQDQALSSICNEYVKGTYHQLISMATGTGKTVVFSRLPDRAKHILPGQSLILAHREELIDQAVAKVRAANPTLRVDKEMAAHYADPSQADIIIASVATLGRKGTQRLNKYNWQNVDKVVTDEAHHSTAQTYLNIYEAAGLMREGDRRLLLGVTATPQRSDGKALAQIYQKIVYSYGMRDAIEDGWLVDIRGVRVSTGQSLDTVKVQRGDFDMGTLADAVNNPQRNQLVVKAWLDSAENRQTVGFTVNIQHAVDLAEMFRHYGVKAEAIWGDDPDRADKLARHKNGDFAVLLNCGVLTEGYDDWRIGCVLLARPTKSGSLYVQMVGRGTRLQEGTGNLLEVVKACPEACIKKDCIVIDVVDASYKHSLVTLPTLMGMSAKLDLKGQSMVRAVQSIEAMQREHANVDFSTLADITGLQTLVESVNMFDVKFPAEVEENSELTWHSAASGGYILQLPNKEQVTIRQNLLDKWELVGTIKGQRYRGERNSIEDIFKAADNLILDRASDTMKILKREAKWHSQPATMAQINLLRKLLKGAPIPPDIDKGKASKLISSFLAAKA